MPINFDEEKQNLQLKNLRDKEEEELAVLLASRHNLPYINLLPISINSDALRLLPENESREGKIVLFDIVGKKIKAAIISPKNEKVSAIIHNLENNGYVISLFITSTPSLEKAWSGYKDISHATTSKAGSFEISSEEILKSLSTLTNLKAISEAINNLIKEEKTFKISKIIETFLGGALGTNASDIHIEPEEFGTRIRLRLDGSLIDLTNIDTEAYHLILSRIKLVSGLKLNIKDEAQDGRFSVKIKNADIEIRTSILPGSYGESIVMRILNPESISVPLEELGIPKTTFDLLMEEIKKPQGMILTTGPTGSGKTTTLYAFLRKVYDPSVKIITIEDPIEYHLPGIVQTQTKTDSLRPEESYTFANGLRAALRQDPDIIMVGEIRDEETAKTAVQAAQTGHLVFSTLHTNNAAGTFPRLMDLGIDPKILMSALNVAIAQRLIRKLCPFCKEKIILQDEEKNKFYEIVSNLPEEYASLKNNPIFKANEKGCEKCNYTGYKGRIGIYEVIKMDERIEKIIINNPSEREIKKASAGQGLLDMRQDGVIKILQGVTSIDELRKFINMNEGN